MRTGWGKHENRMEKAGILAFNLLPIDNIIWRKGLNLPESEFAQLLKRSTNTTYFTGYCCENQMRSCITMWFVNDKHCLIVVIITLKYGLKTIA